MACAKTVERLNEVFVVEKVKTKGLKRTLVYRAFSPKTGEHTNEYAAELLFKDKDSVLAFLTKYNIGWKEVPDVEDFPL